MLFSPQIPLPLTPRRDNRFENFVNGPNRALVEAPPPDIARALDALIRLYYDHSLHYLSKEMWRKAMALSIEAPASPFSQRYTELDAMLSAQVCDLIAALKAGGLTRPDLDAAILGQIAFSALNQMFIEFVKNDAMPLATLQAAVTRQTALLASLLQP